MQQSNPSQPGCGPTPAEQRFHTAKCVVEDTARRIDAGGLHAQRDRRAYERAFRRALDEAAAVRAERLDHNGQAAA